MPASSAPAIDVTDANFETEVIAASRQKPVVVDFWAPWCGPCRILGPVIERVAAEVGDGVKLAKLNTDENPRTATQYRIQGIPAVKAFVDGKVAAEFTGALPESQVRAFFQRLTPSPEAVAAREAEALARTNPAAAEARYREILARSPNNVDAIIGLARLLLQRGDTAGAEQLLDRVAHDRRAKALKHRIFLENFAKRHAGEDLEGAVRANPSDARAHYRWGLMLAARGQYDQAVDELLTSLRLDRNMGDQAARKAMLAIFDILGPDSPKTREYQRKLSSAIF